MPKGTESDAEQGAGLLGSEQLAALFSANITAKAEPEHHDDASEGVVTSGVLDIRALADAYESEFRKMEAASAVEEPPMVSQTGLGLLIPQAQPEKPEQRVPWALIAVIAVLLVAGTAAATAFLVKRSMPAAAAVPTAEQQQVAQAPAATPPASLPATPVPQQVAAPVASPAAEPKAAIETKEKPEVAAAAATDPKREETPEERHARHEARRLAREAEAEAAAKAETETKASPTAAVVEPAQPAPSAEPAKEVKEAKEDKPAGDKCDEVACLVDPNGPCCAKRAGKTEVAKPEPKSEIPERLTAKDVNAGLRPMRGRIDSCGDKNGFSGTAMLKMTIAPSGTVSSASVAEGNAGFQSCLTGYVKEATFAETQKGMTITYPIVFR